MPSITLNRKTVDKLIGKKLSNKDLKEKVPYLGVSLDDLSSNEMHLEVEPNRPDLLSEQGFSRALSSFLSLNTGLRKYSIKKSSHKVIVEDSVKKVRPFTACAIIKGLHFNHEKIREIIQIQEKLHVTYGRNRKKVAIGIYPFEKITTPIRFIAKKPEDIKFQPLDSKKELSGIQILSQHPTGRDYGHLLEGFNKFPIFIDAKNKILSMPPIINSQEVGQITSQTKDIFIECSGFDYKILSICLNMVVTALADMGGEIYSMEINCYGKKMISPNLNPTKRKINIDYVNKRLGLNLKKPQIKILLEKMGFGYVKDKVLIPAYRSDILHQIDLIEDIAIAYGYDNIEGVVPKVATIGEEDKFEIFKRKLSEILVGLGLLECKTFHLANKKNQTNLMNCNIKVIELANALNQEFNVLTAWHIPQLLEVLKNNKHYEYPQNIFNLGTIFKKDDSCETGINEQVRLACLLCSEEADYTRIRQILDYLLRMIDVKYEIDSVEHPSFIEGRCGRLVVNGKKVAFIGEISPNILENWDLDMPVSAFELNLSELYNSI